MHLFWLTDNWYRYNIINYLIHEMAMDLDPCIIYGPASKVFYCLFLFPSLKKAALLDLTLKWTKEDLHVKRVHWVLQSRFCLMISTDFFLGIDKINSEITMVESCPDHINTPAQMRAFDSPLWEIKTHLPESPRGKLRSVWWTGCWWLLCCWKKLLPLDARGQALLSQASSRQVRE